RVAVGPTGGAVAGVQHHQVDVVDRRIQRVPYGALLQGRQLQQGGGPGEFAPVARVEVETEVGSSRLHEELAAEDDVDAHWAELGHVQRNIQPDHKGRHVDD